jgi:hypothetical protein
MTSVCTRRIIMNNKLLFIILILFITPVILLGCTASDNTSLPNTGNLHVKILGVNETPLVGAKVVSNAEPAGQLKITGMTKSDGTVIYNNITAGDYVFYVSVAGYQQTDFKVSIQKGKTTGVTVTLVQATTSSTQNTP